MDVLVDDQAFQSIGRDLDLGIDNDTIAQLEKYLNDDTTMCLPEDAIQAVAYSDNGRPHMPPVCLPPPDVCYTTCNKGGIQSNMLPMTTSSPPQMNSHTYSCPTQLRPPMTSIGGGYDNPMMQHPLPDSPPDSEPYSPPDEHRIVTTSESKFGAINPITTMNQHMYPTHHRPPGVHGRMPGGPAPGYNEPPGLGHLLGPISHTLPPGPGGPIPHPPPQATSSGPLPPLSTSSQMNNPQIISPHTMSPNMSQSTKKRKYSDSPNSSLTNALLNNRSNPMNIKQEPNSSSYANYMVDCDDEYNSCYDADSSGNYLDSQYQVIKWQPHLTQKWNTLTDSNLKDLPTPQYRVDADKGFNFSIPDDSFVCQKKNHFQVTVHIGLTGDPRYIRTPDGVKKIDCFCVHFHGIKVESPNQMIKVEQSQSDRTKKLFHPVKIDLVPEQTNKVTVGRLHFSETTSNNMRKKGRPNPDQRYFMLVVSLHAHSGENSYMVAASNSERLIVRASNPGQFDSDVDVLWQKTPTPDGVFHLGRVGINTDHPEEALSVHGNIKLTGHLLQPSDIRAKEELKELESKDQLKKVAQMKIYQYKYSEDFAKATGMEENRRQDTGVIAQEVMEVLPDAVQETGDVMLPDGQRIENLLVVNKERIFMENVGAVKELCKLTDNLEVRIDELEKMNSKLSKLKRFDSIKSTVSNKSACSVSTISSMPKTRSYSNKHHQRSHHNRPSSSQSEQGWCSNRFIQLTIIALILIMALCLIAITVLYILERQKETSMHIHVTNPSVESGESRPIHGHNHSAGGVHTHAPTLPIPTEGTTTNRKQTTEPTHRTAEVTTEQHTSTPSTPSTPIDTLVPAYPICNVECGLPQCCNLRNDQDRPPYGPFRPTSVRGSATNVNGDENLTEQNDAIDAPDGSYSVATQAVDNLPRSYPTQPTESNNIPEVVFNNRNINSSYHGYNVIQVTNDRKKRSAADMKAEITLVELNFNIQHLCTRDGNNNTCILKLSPHFGFQPVTIKFKLNQGMRAHLCNNYTYQSCHREAAEIDSSVLNEWKIAVGETFFSYYKFRVSNMNNTNVCFNKSQDGQEITFSEYNLHFERTCLPDHMEDKK